MMDVIYGLAKFKTKNGRYPTLEEFKANKTNFLGRWVDQKFEYFIQAHQGLQFPILIHLSSRSHLHWVFVMHPQKRLSFMIELDEYSIPESFIDNDLIISNIINKLHE